MGREEAEALDELRKLLISLGGAGVTRELADSIRRSAEEVSCRVQGSAEVAELYDKILRASQPPLSPEPDSCRLLREMLGGGDVTTRTIIAALAASGFRGRRHIPSREEECFRDIIHASLQSLRARMESTEGVRPDRLQSRIASLRELLEALPPDVTTPRRLVEKIIRQLEAGAARDDFDKLLKGLRKLVEEQDTASVAAARAEAQSNAWALAHPAAPEVKEAQQHFARLEELQRAHSTMRADADRVRALVTGGRQDYDEALGEVQMAESRLRQTGLLKREALDEAIALLVDRLAKEFEWEERAASDPAPAEATLEARLRKLRRLSVWLQKLPAAAGIVADGLRGECASLLEKCALLLNDVRVSVARGKLRDTPVDGVPAYVEELRSSELLTLREWSWEVQRVLDALRCVRDAGAAPVEQTELERLERAEEILGRCPLAQGAEAAVRAYRAEAARRCLRESRALAQAVEDACLSLSHGAHPSPLGDAITSAVQSILRYRLMQDEAAPASAEARRQFPDECAEIEERVRRARQSRLPEAVNRWAERAAAAARSEDEVAAMRRSLAAWREVLGSEFSYDDISRRFNERSAELQIQALEDEGRFEEALRLLKAKPALLSDEFLLALEQRLQRRRAARDYATGRENDVVAVVRRFGPDPDLLRILIDDFRTNSDCQHLARLHGSMPEIESVNRQAALLVSWSFDFQSDSLDELAAKLAACEEPESVALFAKAVAAGGRHAAALRVLGDTLKHGARLPPAARGYVEASYRIVSDRFASACREIAFGICALLERCDPERLARRPAPREDDAELLRQIEAALTVARNFLSAAVVEVEHWHDYLATAKSLRVEFDTALLGGAQELDHKLVANRQILTQLTVVWRAISEKGWEHLSDLENALNVAAFTPKVAQVAAVTQLLHEYLKNYRPTTECVGRLVEAWRNGGDGLTRAELTRLVERLTGDAELSYDFRRGQDRFRQTARFGGKTFAEFVGELEVMTAEIEVMVAYEEQLNDLLVGEKDLLRLRLEQGSEISRQEIVNLLRRLNVKGASLLELYKNPPRISKSPVAAARLRALQGKPWFDLLRRAAALAEDPKDEGVVHDRA